MAKIEKIGNMQVIDNKEDMFFLFSYDFYGLYRVWVRKEKINHWEKFNAFPTAFSLKNIAVSFYALVELMGKK